ncbi:pre-rRNA-processing protein TSR1 homolog isoform X2 [Penaeus japonicus]|uniref:pre-rRNA-processing protein TSR1 homolog isoform X2 n=1 Tax=Penaeus japonicus TaxID=27405 RepID=UPI001C714BA6|nr:pre-rRNA-processing protein TSR1 homolog isoform X2 [Penaeus japonicus]
MALATKHRASALKQQNKKHKVLGHRTKGQLTKVNKGRVAIATLSRRAKKELSREERKNQMKQIRSQKREEATSRKRAIGTANNPPFLVTIVPLSPDINPRKVISALTSCDPEATITTSAQGVVHLSSLRYKQRFSFIIPPVNDLYAILDSVKVSNTLMLLWPSRDELEDAADLLLSSIMAQALPATVHISASMEDMAHKRKIQMRQRMIKEIESRFPGNAKLFSVDNDQEAMLVLRHIGSQKQRPVFFKDNRPHMMAEKVEFEEKGPTGTLKVSGYVRGQPLSVNGLVHIPGWGDFQMSHTYLVDDPHPLERRGKNATMASEEPQLIEEADPERQETLISTNEVDPMEGEQTWPTQEELEEAEASVKAKPKTKRVPKGTSEYQAAWILDSEEEDGDEDDDSNSEMDNSEFAPVDAMSQDGCEQDEEDEEEDEEEYETMTMPDTEGANYDDKYDYKEEMDALEKLRAAREDAVFPDEIDTPKDIPSRIRFQKYRGLQSFRTSSWDADENLPVDYSRIFQFKNFIHSKKRILKEEREGALPGWYVIVHVQDVPRHLYDSQVTSQAPLVLFGLLPHEQKMSVMNVVIKSHPLGHYRPIKSKERLIFHIGFRRFANCPIFSEHSTGNKHKFARYFHPGTTVVASMFAPITFPPVSVLMFRERPDGAQDLVGTGSLYDMNPKRIVVKRAVLSGYPFKINRKSAVIRYMFFNREDILWFKPVELRTKWGRRGHIKEALGTHGHMKCYFDGQLKAQDTILLNLYKRMFPKWTFDPHVARPPPLYTFRTSGNAADSSDEENEENPPAKKAKVVQFHNSGL